MELRTFYPSLVLNADQIVAVDALHSFLNGNDAQVFLLKGYAGTGKTTLLKGVMDYLDAQKRNFMAMAPTGRAARVLSSKTGQTAITIHSSLFTVNIDDDGEPNFLRRQSPENGTIIIVDEASMIQSKLNTNDAYGFGLSGQHPKKAFIANHTPGQYLFDDLFVFANLDQNPDTRIIFIGDDAQLQPIVGGLSPVFDEKLMQSLGWGYSFASLRKVERNDNGILRAATAIREELVNNKRKDLYPLPSNEVVLCKSTTLVDIYLKNHKDVIDTYNSMVVLLSNTKVHDANVRIRKHFFGLNCERTIYTNDRLMVYSNLYGENFFFNGDELRVKSVGEAEFHTTRIKLSNKEKESIFKDRLSFIKKLPNNIHIVDDEAEVRMVLQRLTIVDLDGNENEVLISNDFLFSESSETHPIYRRALHVKAMMEYKQHIQDREKIRTSPLSKEDFLRRCKFSNVLYVKFGYAVTCHKAQGGEWDNVFTTATYIPIHSGSEDHYRWVYTALTRAAQFLCVGVPYVR